MRKQRCDARPTFPLRGSCEVLTYDRAAIHLPAIYARPRKTGTNRCDLYGSALPKRSIRQWSWRRARASAHPCSSRQASRSDHAWVYCAGERPVRSRSASLRSGPTRSVLVRGCGRRPQRSTADAFLLRWRRPLDAHGNRTRAAWGDAGCRGSAAHHRTAVEHKNEFPLGFARPSGVDQGQGTSWLSARPATRPFSFGLAKTTQSSL